jgi:predicted aspartyl protease
LRGDGRRFRSPFGLLALLVSVPGCGDFSSSPKVEEPNRPQADKADARPGPRNDDLQRSQDLWKNGRLAEFTSFVLSGSRMADSAEFKLLQVEGLLATGRLDDAEQLAAKVSEGQEAAQDRLTLIRAHKLHLLAQLRQRKALTGCRHTDSETFADDELRSVRFWQEALQGDSPYQITDESATLAIQPLPVWSGLASHEYDSISVDVNGVSMPVAFIDTGAQWTILTTQAAARAGIEPAELSITLTGFSSADARPAVARELALGSLILRNVPVLVADTTPLLEAKGQLTIGLDVLYHLRTTIDPGYCAVTFTDASATSDPEAETSHARWEIPVFNFSTAMLAQGRIGDESARVLIDTGNAVGTFVSARWADRVLPQVRNRRPPPTLWFKKRKFELPAFELAGQQIEHWPVVDSLPAELEQLNTVDLVFGRDLYSNYRITIDPQANRLLLDDGSLPPSPARKPRRSSVEDRPDGKMLP